MIGTIIGIILALIVLGVIWWAIESLLPLIPLPPTFAQIIRVLMVLLLVIIVIWVIITLLASAGVHVPLVH